MFLAFINENKNALPNNEYSIGKNEMEEQINKFDNLTKKFIDKRLTNMLKLYTQDAFNKNVNKILCRFLHRNSWY